MVPVYFAKHLRLKDVLVKSLIVEDEPLARKTLRDLVGATSWLTLVGEAADGISAIQMIEELNPHLLFLDIDLPELNGLQVLERLSHQPHVVFTTAHDKYAVSAFEFDALDYLLKPFGRERFQQTLERIRRRFAISEPPAGSQQTTLDRARHALMTDERTALTRIFVRDGEVMLPINVRDIIRLEACDDYTAVYLTGRKYLIHVTLTEFTRRLDPETFLRVHRSHTVNLDHVKSAEEFDRRLVLYLSDGSEVTASRSGTQEFRRLYTWA
jgi:two-component system, LytTR family, response regulator